MGTFPARTAFKFALSSALTLGVVTVGTAAGAGALVPRTSLFASAHRDLARFQPEAVAPYAAPNGALAWHAGASSPRAATSPVSWTPLGPGGGYQTVGGNNAGRVTGLAVTPGSSPTLYLASAGGGVWSSSDGGASWATHTDSQPNLAMGSIALDPNNPSYVFAGTGEANSCSDCQAGDGVMESRDGGATWTTSNPGGIFTGTYTSAVVVEPGASSLDTTTVLAGGSNNLYVSPDGGVTWNPEAGTGWIAGAVMSLVINPLTSAVSIYAWVQGVGLEMSSDNGATWTTTQTAGASSSQSDGALTIAPNAASGNTVLFLSVGGASSYLGMYKSSDGGLTWTLLTNCTTSSTGCIPYFTSPNYAYNGQNNDGGGDQSNYDNVVAIDPSNPNIVVAGGVTAVESTDGGANWINLDANSGFANFHPDFHALAFDDAGNLYMGNDGGIWKMSSANLASENLNFSNLNNNLNTIQFYPGIAQLNNASEILAGSQDNGTLEYVATAPPASAWTAVDSGDGGAVAIDPSNPNFQVSEADISSQGSLDATSDGWVTTNPLTLPPFTSTNWVSPLQIVPNTAGPTIVFGGDGVYISSDGGATWATPSGYTASRVSSLAIAPSDPSVLYAGFNDGTIQMSSDGGATWATVDTLANANAVWHISVSATDPYTIYLAANTSHDGALFEYGAPQIVTGSGLDTATPTWSDVSGNLPSNEETSAVIAGPHGGLIAATDIGVYWASTLNGASTNWQRLGAGLPNVQVADVLLTVNDTLLAATHGRGLWTIPFASAINLPATVCTWAGGTGASGSDWSVGVNWTTTSGSSCGGPGGPPAGASIVFPANPINAAVTWDSGTESGGGGAPSGSYDSITIEDSNYHFTNANANASITLTPSSSSIACGTSTDVGLCAGYASGSVTLPMNFTLDTSERFAVAHAAATLEVSGTVSDLVGSFGVGATADVGTVTLSADNASLTAATTVFAGTLNVTGTLPGALSVSSGATLGGSGSLGSIVNDGGTIAPGASSTTPGTLTSLGSVDLQATGSGVFAVTLVGAAPQAHSQLVLSQGTINLDNVTLSIAGASQLAGGSSFTLVSLASGASATGTFAGLANGDSFVANGTHFVITYPSQNGGDPTQGALLTALSAPATPSAPTASAANASASLSWSPPSSDGGLAITNYSVTAVDATNAANGGQRCTWTSGPFTCTMSGLINGDSYTFSVTATNAVGTSSASASSTTVTPLPNRPSPLTISFAPKNAKLSPGARQALQGLSKNLANGASITIHSFAPKNAKLARSRAQAVTSLLSQFVSLNVKVIIQTKANANKATVTTTKE